MTATFARSAARLALIALMTALMTVLSGCSPSWFGGSGVDTSLTSQSSYHQVPASCAGLKLSSDQLSAQDLRGLVGCLNSSQSLGPLAEVITSLNDQQLQPIADWLSHDLIQNSKRLYDLDTSIYQEQQSRLLTSALAQLSVLLERRDAIDGIIKLSHDIYQQQPDLILKAMSQMSERLDDPILRPTLDDLLDLVTSPALQSLLNDLGSDHAGARPLAPLVQAVITEAHALESADESQDLFLEFLQNIAQGKILKVVDDRMGTTASAIQANTLRSAQVLDTINGHDAQLLKGLNSLVTGMRHVPIICFNGSMVIPDLALHSLQDLRERPNPADARDFLVWQAPLLHVAGASVCNWPPGFATDYHWIEQLALSPAEFESHRLVTEILNQGLQDFLLDLFTAQGSDHQGGMLRVAPLLAELTDRGATPDVLLTATVLSDAERARLYDWIQFLITPRPELEGKSIYLVLRAAVAGLDAGAVTQEIQKITPTFVKAQAVGPLLRLGRSLFYSNDVYPLRDWAKDFLIEAPLHRALTESLFAISSNPKFLDALQFTAALAKDGRLENLISDTLAIFRSRATRWGAHPIHLTEEPTYFALRRHELSRSSLDPIQPEPPLVSSSALACSQMDLTLGLGSPSSLEEQQKFTTLAACLNDDGNESDLAQGLSYLDSQKTSTGDSELSFTYSLINGLFLKASAAEAQDLFSRVFKAVDSGRAQAIFVGTSLLIDPPRPVLRPLLDTLGPLTGELRDQFERLTRYGASVLRRPDLPEILSYIDRVFDDQPTVSPVAGDIRSNAELRRKLIAAVRNHECIMDPVQIEARLDAIYQEYEQSETDWESNGAPTGPTWRTDWAIDDFKAELEPLFVKMADPSAQVGDRTIVTALLNFFHYFNGDHYDPGYLYTWLKDRSNDVGDPILYFYPGESKPRVRLVNSLDRLDLVLLNADFSFLLPEHLNEPTKAENYGKYFLGLMGEAFGDDPESSWPAEIKAQLKPGKKPKTLRQAYQAILDRQKFAEGGIYYPPLPRCRPDPTLGDDGIVIPRRPSPIALPPQMLPHGVSDARRRTFNLRQVVRVIEENLPDAAGPHAGGMRLLRDLFWELSRSTPPQYRNATSGDRNNLSVINRLARMGLIHQIGRKLRSEPDTQDFRDFFKNFVIAANTPYAGSLLNTLFVSDPQQALFWNMIGQIFDTLDHNTVHGANMGRFAFYTVAALGSDPINAVEPALSTLAPALATYYNLAASRTDVVQKLASSTSAADFMEGLYWLGSPSSGSPDDQHAKGELGSLVREAVGDQSRVNDVFQALHVYNQSAVASQGWNDFIDRFDAVKTTPAYQAADWGGFASEAYSLFKQRPYLREWLADRMEAAASRKTSDAFEIVDLINRDPDQFYQILQGVADNASNGKDTRFLREFRESLVPAAH